MQRCHSTALSELNKLKKSTREKSSAVWNPPSVKEAERGLSFAYSRARKSQKMSYVHVDIHKELEQQLQELQQQLKQLKQQLQPRRQAPTPASPPQRRQQHGHGCECHECVPLPRRRSPREIQRADYRPTSRRRHHDRSPHGRSCRCQMCVGYVQQSHHLVHYGPDRGRCLRYL